MSHTGVQLRLSRLFQKDGRSVVVALDHGAIVGPQPGWKDPAPTIEAVFDGHPDAIITTLGILQRYLDLIKGRGISIILTLPLLDDSLKEIESASKMGVDAIKLFVPIEGGSSDSANMAKLLKAALNCHYYGIPLIGEIYPIKSEKISDPKSEEVVAKYSRIGMEQGADVIKTFYTGTEESFGGVVRCCPVPILILGGEKMDTDRELLQTIDGAIKAGAAGAAIGRNVWQHKRPNAITKSIVKIVHERQSVQKCLDELS